MTAPFEILDTLQADIVAVLKATPGLENAFVFTGSEKDLATKLAKTFATRTTGREGKRGLGLQVLPVFVEEADANLPGPPLKLRLQVLCVESLLANRGASGTGTTSSQAALTALAALHLRSVGILSLYSEGTPVRPEAIDEGFEAHLVTVHARANGLAAPEKVLGISQSMAGDPEMITLATATPDAAIHYTLDGSYPAPIASTLYTTPFPAPAVGTLVRCAAYKPGMNPGDCLEFDIT
jgi:hypothetical protein